MRMMRLQRSIRQAELALQTCIYAPIYLFFIMYVCSSHLDSSIAQKFGDNLEKVHSMKQASYVDNVSNFESSSIILTTVLRDWKESINHFVCAVFVSYLLDFPFILETKKYY